MNEVFWGKGGGKKEEENGYLGEVSGGDEEGRFIWEIRLCMRGKMRTNLRRGITQGLEYL